MIIRKRILALLLILALASGCACAAAEWTCPGCGAANTTAYCPSCGTQNPEASGTAHSARYEGDGFDTPEAALACYMEGLKNLDFEQMLSAFAWETQIDHYSFDAYFKRIKAYQPTMIPRIPSVNGFMRDANVAALQSNQVIYLYRSIENYILMEDAPQGMIVTFREDEEVKDYLKKFDNGRLERLARMTNIRFVSPDDVTGGMFSNGKMKENFEKQTAHYGADETVNLIGLADVGDEILFCCPTICRYGEKWYLVSISSMVNSLIGLSVDSQGFFCVKGTEADLMAMFGL